MVAEVGAGRGGGREGQSNERLEKSGVSPHTSHV